MRHDGGRQRITWDGSDDIVYGGAAHRAEFGISDGLWWDGAGRRLAFSREDLRPIDAYPYADYEAQLQQRLTRLQKSIANARSLETAAELIVEHFLVIYGEIPNLSRALYEYATRSPRAAESKQLAERRPDSGVD